MASTKKFSHAAMCDENGHIDREHDKPGNTDIDPERTHLNYSFPMSYDAIKPFQYYKQRVGEVYMYGRGSRREKEAITGCGWIVTLPKELYGNPEKEKAFFKGVYDFIEKRYGKENIINNSVHYDEGGLPHIHVIFSPITKLEHDVVQYKTKRTKQAVKLESGRWEYKYIHVDKNGKPVDETNPETWVKLNNYARMSDYYDEKVDCNSVLNPIELRHFHPDLQQYLTENGIEGKVVTGKTGTNFTVKELKDFTSKTGMHLDEVKEMMHDNTSLLENFVEKDAKVVQLEDAVAKKDAVIEALKNEILTKNLAIDKADKSAEIAQKDEQIRKLTHAVSTRDQTIKNAAEQNTELQRTISFKDKLLEVKQDELDRAQSRIEELTKASDRNTELQQKLADMVKALENKQGELERAQARVEELEKQQNVKVSQTDRTQGWGQSSASAWGQTSQSGWGQATTNTTIEEDRTTW